MLKIDNKILLVIIANYISPKQLLQMNGINKIELVAYMILTSPACISVSVYLIFIKCKSGQKTLQKLVVPCAGAPGPE